MDAAESEAENDAPDATGEAEPRCALCDGSIGVFLELGLDWRHFAGDGMTFGQQHVYDPGHSPNVAWHLDEHSTTQH